LPTNLAIDDQLLAEALRVGGLRRRRKGEAEQVLARKVDELLPSDEQVAAPGIVLQELLGGIAERSQYERVLAGVRASFSIVLATEGDHLKAADIVNGAPAKAVVRSAPDALIAAQAPNRRGGLLTRDADFAKVTKFACLRFA
jgi:predicted nucleic acid-binding protein